MWRGNGETFGVSQLGVREGHPQLVSPPGDF